MAFIKAQNLIHKFLQRNEEGEVIGETLALDGVDLEVEQGQFIVVLGHNGSGKSTFAKHLNVLLSPTEGSLWVDGKDVSDEDETWNIRQTAGMIFQNPDNQIVAGVIEEDVAFGPENIGVPTEEIWVRVAESLEAVGMTAYRYHSPNKLSGGQKQRVAIAGVVAMRPKCIIMDEPTAMLDPDGRQEVLKTVHRLNKEEGVTVILITHFMEEAVDADRIFVMNDGKVCTQGKPEDIFVQTEQLAAVGLDIPQVTRLAVELRNAGLDIPKCILTRQELTEAIAKLYEGKASTTGKHEMDCETTAEKKQNGDTATGKTILSLQHVNYHYAPGTGYEMHALKDVSLDIHEGEFLGLIGHTGSGKSTMIQLMNGLLKTQSGNIYYDGQDIYGNGFSLRRLRGQVGLVFQYAEYQLFETTVLKDVLFGPKNLGLSEEEGLIRARKALNQVKLPEEYWEMSPFELSGGQKRRAAIAGVLAMEPSVLIMDEPTAGLDPRGRDELFALIRELHESMGMTIILVSHSMEDVAEYVDRIVVMNGGSIMLDGSPMDVFAHREGLEQAHLAVPEVTYLMEDLRLAGVDVGMAITVEQAKEEILKGRNC